MRALFVAYCFGDDSGQTLVGVYKRGLRVALELRARGHEVLFDCTGRRSFRDDLTDSAAERLEFVDLFADLSMEGDSERRRAHTRRAVAARELDLVVVGEAPLAGTLLEGTLCAVELGIPVAVLDNAYNDGAADDFLRNHGGMVDAVVLTGPSCSRTTSVSERLLQVPPFVSTSPSAATSLLDSLAVRPDRLVSVLGYDAKVERLGFSLLERLDSPETDFLFISRRPAAARRRAAELPPAMGARVRVVDLPPDPVLFGLIQSSRLAIVKYGFMQVTECLSLRTPVICAFHEGATWVDLLPRQCQRFVHVTREEQADAETIARAESFLSVDPAELESIHDGRFDATRTTADFLERVARDGSRAGWNDAVDGFSAAQVRTAMRAALGHQPTAVALRAMRVRSSPGEEVHSLICRFTIDGHERSLRLLGRRYTSWWRARIARVDARSSGRRIVAASPRSRALIELDLGQHVLPPL
jgi:hypothetical protein